MIKTPYGEATDAADAVVRYSMNGAICPLEIAQTARDDSERMRETLTELDANCENRSSEPFVSYIRQSARGALSGRKAGDLAYDYRAQAWVRWNGTAWVVQRCGHPLAMDGCYSCDHAGETVETHDEIH